MNSRAVVFNPALEIESRSIINSGDAIVFGRICGFLLAEGKKEDADQLDSIFKKLVLKNERFKNE